MAWRRSGLGGAALVASGCWTGAVVETPRAAPAVAQVAHEPDPPARRDPPRAAWVIAQMAARYRSAQTYADHGEIVHGGDGSPPRTTTRFETAFVRPGALRYAAEIKPTIARSPGALLRPEGAYVLWTIGDDVYAALPGYGAEVHRGLTDTLQASSLRGIDVTSAAPLLLLDLPGSVARLPDPGIVGEDTIDGHACWQVSARVAEAVVTLSIDEATFALRRAVRSTAYALTIATYAPVFDGEVTAVDLAGPDIALEPPPRSPPRARIVFSPPVSPPVSPLVGKAAPPLSVDAIANASERRLELPTLRGHVVVLDFWATWCRPCQEAVPKLDDLQRAHVNAGLRVIGVSSEEADEIRDFAGVAKLGYTLARDATGAAHAAYGATAIPQLVVIDKRGLVRQVYVGAGHDVDLATLVARLLAE